MEEQNKAVVERLLTIFAGKADISSGVEIIAQDVISHMDNYTFQGINVWARWVSFIRSRGRVSELDLTLDRLVVNPDQTITPYGRWKALYKGKPVVSAEVSATYRLKDRMIVEIWTTRKNYILTFGPIMRSRVGCLLILLYHSFWNKLAGRLDLRLRSAE